MINNDIDAAILNIIQKNFPVSSRPYLDIAKILAPFFPFVINENDIFTRIQKMRTSGIIRRIGANFDSKKLGCSSTLCACSVPENRLNEFVNIVNSYEGVTHNYLRRHKYNVWFTLIAKNACLLDEQIKQIENKTKTRITSLPAGKVFKLQLNFEIKAHKLARQIQDNTL